MKLRIRIIGPKVHDVGYRYFLMSMAMANRIRRFEAHNIEEDAGDEVLVLVDGSEQEIQAFRKHVEMKRRPERAEVSKVIVEDYEGEVMTIGEYAQFCTTVQMNKAIPLLLSMNETMGVMADKQAETLSEIRGLSGKQDQTISEIRGLSEKQDQTISEIRGLSEKQDQTISEIRGLSGKQDSTVSEIRGLRGDLATRNNIEWQTRIEKDIKVIKSKLSIR